MNTTPTTNHDREALRERVRRLNLYGLLEQDDALLDEPWVTRLVDIEETERQRRSLQRRLDHARLSAFKPLADFDWNWPSKIDRPLIEELFHFDFVTDAANPIVLGPNGVGKSMLAKNLLHQGVLRGFTARFTTASDMLHDLAAQDSTAALARRLRRYTQPSLLCVDEIGYLAYDNRYADLLFEVVTRRYLQRPVILTTNRPFGQWSEIFPNAACVVTLVDRLVHRSEIISIDGESYRLKEAKERSAKRTPSPPRRKPRKKTSS